jgi:hypothetical protein
VPALISHFFSNNPDETLYTTSKRIVRPPGLIPLDEASKLAELDPIWAERGKAIQSYALLEQSLCSLMEHLGDIPESVAPIIFYKITSTGVRKAIIEKLLHRKHGSKFNLFWNQYLESLRPIDIKRNQIVHWLSVSNVKVDSESTLHSGVMLVPPNFHAASEDGPHLTTKDLKAFSKKCSDFADLATIFWKINTRPYEFTSTESWMKIFQQPLIYPLPEDHLLFQTRATPQTQPLSLPE